VYGYSVPPSKMGAACTRLDIPPSVVISSKPTIVLSDCRFETVWKFLGPYVKGAVERNKMRNLLRTYLANTPCRDRYFVLTLDDRRWVFEIASHRPGPDYTEVVLQSRVKR
jgi:hypothetical protein